MKHQVQMLKRTLRHWASTLALAALVLFAPTAWGQGQLTVYESATGTNQYIPIYGYWADSPQHNQMLYPASELTDMTDSVITQMVFYLASGFTGNSIGDWTISLGETTSTTLGGLDNSTVLTQVYSGGMNIDATTGAMTITFSEGYVYNGGNLLVDFTHAAASYRSMTFYGESVTSASVYQYSSYSAVTQDFLPKVTFSYEAVPSCLKPRDLVCSNYTSTTATLNWTEMGTATSWVLQYSTDNTFTTGVNTINSGFSTSGSTVSVALTGLTAETQLYARVKAVCNSTDESEWSNAIDFTPSAIMIVSIGLSGTATSDYLPSQTYYDYSYTQQIYTAAEIGEPGEIHNISFKGNNSAECDLDIYMVNTTKETFTSNTDVIAISEATLVYSGTYTFTANDWSTITLQTPFDYEGGNLAIIVDDNSGNYVYGTTTWQTFSATNQSVYFYQDDNDINPVSPSAYNNSRPNSKNQIKIGILRTTTPKPRNLAVDYVAPTTATLTWEQPNVAPTGYQYQYQPDGGSWTSLTSTTTLSASLTSLTPSTLYNFRVKALYEGGGESDFATIPFTTLASCTPPTNVAVTGGSITPRSATITWTASPSNPDSYIIMVGEEYMAVDADFEDGTLPADFTTNVHPWTVVANDHSGAYCAKSGNGGANSSTSEMVLEVTLTQDATLTFSAKISSETSWDKGYFSIDGANQSDLNGISGNGSWIDYSYALTAGTHLLSWYYTKDSSTSSNDDCLYVDDIKIAAAPSTWDESRTAQSSPYTLTGLNPGTTYQVKVKGVCGSEQSVASDVVAFTTTVACPAPTGLAVDNTSITTNSATLNWTAGAVETAWDIFYTSDATLVPDNTTLPTTTASNNPTASISGLSVSTYYYVYVRANCGTDDGVSAWSAVESFQTLASCQAPQNLTATNLTANGATLNWTDPNSGTVDGYTIKLWDGAVESDVATVTTTSYSLTTLNPITTYTYRVYTNCSSTETSLGYAEVTFTTLCGIITTFPITYGFETSEGFPSNSSIPTENTLGPCWRNIATVQTGSNATRVWGTSTSNKHAGSQALVLPDKGNSSNPAKTMLVFPAMNFTNANGYVVSLWVYRNNTSTNPEGFKVYASNTDTIDANAVELGHYSRNYNIAYPRVETASGWYQYETSPIMLTGTVYLIFEGQSYYGNATYVDDVMVKVAPTCFQPIAAVATNVLQTTATLNWTRDDRNATGETYSILDENGDPLTDPAAANISGTTYTLNGLTDNTSYIFLIQTNCANSSENVEPVEVTFTTLPLCPAPVLEATDINVVDAHNATVAWTGYPDNNTFTVSYRTASYLDVPNAILNEGFGTTIPSGWENKTGLLSSIMGGSAFGTTTQWSFGTNNGVFDNHARINIYGTSRYGWLITPATSLGTGYALNFDLALTAYSGTGAASGTCDDDRFVILVSTDDEATWTILREWNNSGSADVYNTIATAGENVTIDLSSYAGQTVRIAFYGESTVTSNGDNNLHIDNLMVAPLIPAGAWTDVTNADNPTTLTSLTAETLYDVKVTGICTTGTNESATQQFTTLVACPAPTNLTAGTPGAREVQLSWDENGTATNWIVAYKADADADFTPVSVTDNPYTLTGLTPETHYTIKVSADCGTDDGTSQWSNTVSLTTDVSCSAPTGLTVSNVTTADATLGWTETGTAMAWQICVNGDEENLIDVTTNPYTLTGLTDGTTYTVKVRANCGTEDFSTWSNEESFTTLFLCPAPTDVAVTDGSVTAQGAEISWTGTSDSYIIMVGEEYMAVDADFEDGTLPADITTNEYPWTVVENDHSGAYCAKSANGENEQTSSMTLTVTLAQDATLTFSAKISSEDDYDKGYFYIDDVVQSNINGISGDGSWIDYSYALAAGTHTLQWKYTKDVSLASYDDCFYVDDIKIVADPTTWDSTRTAPSSPYTLTGLNPETNYRVRVKGVCTAVSRVSLPSTYVAFTTQSAFTMNVEAEKWYALSSPMHDDGAQTESLANITNLLPTSAGDFAYDLFRYDEATTTWENQQNTVHTDFDVFEQARGYIYRRDNTATLTFAGEPNTGNISIDLTADADGDLQGFNLVGNPYHHTYTLNERCYSLTTDGSWEVHPTNYDLSIAEAVMVNTTTARTLTFTENTSSKGSHSAAPALAFTVKGGGLQDVAYASLTEGDGMPKLSHFNEAAPVLSIPVDGRRYAIADLGTDCESFDMTFRGIEGEYTLTFNSQLSTLNYCHLIDKVNGKDIDLLAQNTYTFTHSNTNTLISDRFQVKLTPNVEESTTGNFAYWNGDAWVVEGTGTLEVYDVVGRLVKRVDVNSQLSILNSQFPTTGVYVLRMGDKNQKIVVR